MNNLNERSWYLLEDAENNAQALGTLVQRAQCGTKIFDCGVEAAGGLQAGLLMARAGMAGLGQLSWDLRSTVGIPWMWISVQSDHPLAACFMSQAAHWSVDDGALRSMGSGPGCLLNQDLGVGQKFGYEEKSGKAVLVLEGPDLPKDPSCRKLADLCGVTPENMALMVAPTACMAGSVQIAARSLETGLHKLHQMGFDLHKVVSGSGESPISPPGGDDLTALGRTNDMIFLGAGVSLFIRETTDDELQHLAEAMPSSSSPMYGKPFLQILREEGGFYNVDPGLFAPAEVTLVSLESGAVFHAGGVDEVRLAVVLKGQADD